MAWQDPRRVDQEPRSASRAPHSALAAGTRRGLVFPVPSPLIQA